MVAGIIGYWRSLNSPWKDQLQRPSNVKKLVRTFHHAFGVSGVRTPDANSKRVMWNGQVLRKNCLTDYATRNSWDKQNNCPSLQANLDNQPDGPNGNDPFSGIGPTASNKKKRKNIQNVRLSNATDGSNVDSDNPKFECCACESPADSNGDDAGADGTSISFTSTSAKPSPTCTSGGCGVLCTGYYCTPHPTGTPPAFLDPKDPNSSHSRGSGPSITSGTSTGTSSPSSPCGNDDKCKLDRGNACNCNEDGCDADSPGCCASGSCPACDCGESSCSSSSPSCCASNTCKWSWTGGGGGTPGGGQTPGNGAGVTPKGNANYTIWSKTSGMGSKVTYEIMGYESMLTAQAACDTNPVWQLTDKQHPSLQTQYNGIKVYGDTCNYTASVHSYSGIQAGTRVGNLICKEYSLAMCFRGDGRSSGRCSSGGAVVAEELLCSW